MIRYSIFLLTIVALAAFGLSKLATAQASQHNQKNVSVIYQTAFAGGTHPIVLERCAKNSPLFKSCVQVMHSVL